MARWLRWPRGLAGWVGKIYLCWRNHLADPLNSTNPEEKFTQEFLRYYLVGCECVLGCALEKEEDEEEGSLPYDIQQRVEQDLGELESLLPHLPVDVRLRVHSMRFYFWCLVDDQTEVAGCGSAASSAWLARGAAAAAASAAKGAASSR